MTNSMKLERRLKYLDDKWKRWANNVDKKTSLAEYFLHFCLFGIFGIAIFLFLYAFILPQALPLGKTSAVNWLVLHNHSIALDYIRFTTFVVVIPTTIVLGWLVSIWKKGK